MNFFKDFGRKIKDLFFDVKKVKISKNTEKFFVEFLILGKDVEIFESLSLRCQKCEN